MLRLSTLKNVSPVLELFNLCLIAELILYIILGEWNSVELGQLG
jgi:hypothetical protein